MFDTGTLDGFKGAVDRWLLPRVTFFLVFLAQVLAEHRKQFINNFVFPSWTGASCFNNNNNNNNNNRSSKIFIFYSDLFYYGSLL